MTIYIIGLVVLTLITCLYYILNETELQEKYIIDFRLLCVVFVALVLWPCTMVYLIADYGIEKFMDYKDK